MAERVNRVDYKTAADLGLDRRRLHPETWRELKAIELAICALNQTPWFEVQFNQRRRSTDEITSGVYTLEDLLLAVSENCNGRRKALQLQTWGQKILNFAQNGIDNDRDGYHQRAANFVFSHLDTFRVAISSSEE